MTHPCVRRREEPPRCSSAAANETTRISERYRSLTGIIGVLGAFPIRFARLLGLLAIVLADLLPGLGVVFRGDRKSVVSGKSVSVRVDLGGRRIHKKKRTIYQLCTV